MKYLILLIIVFYSSRFQPAVAQVEQWDTYMVKAGNAPTSVLVDMGLIEAAPDKRFPFLVITGPKTKNCNTMGLPDKDEIGVLEDMLGATGNFLTGVTPKVLAGTVTRNCERVNYYYVKDTSGVRTALNRLYTRNYKTYAYVLGIKADPEWDSYRKFLYPDEETHNWMDNDKIITKMMLDGDSLKTLRTVNFEVCFNSDSSRSAFLGYARAKGYKVVEQTSKTPGFPLGVLVAHSMLIKMEAINPLSMEMKVMAREYHGYYAGWAAK